LGIITTHYARERFDLPNTPRFVRCDRSDHANLNSTDEEEGTCVRCVGPRVHICT
jgi:hypothetical protein